MRALIKAQMSYACRLPIVQQHTIFRGVYVYPKLSLFRCHINILRAHLLLKGNLVRP